MKNKKTQHMVQKMNRAKQAVERDASTLQAGARAVVVRRSTVCRMQTEAASASVLQAMATSAVVRQAVRRALDEQRREGDLEQLAMVQTHQHSQHTSPAQEAAGTARLRAMAIKLVHAKQVQCETALERLRQCQRRAERVQALRTCLN